ncbi:MAG: ABC transporter permease, partial [Oscillospiraceae bacterium]|nr:ABC transporter permease [Oscillospiraceae bacterium]
MDVLMQLLNGSMLAATFRMATPLILGGTGGVFSERAGIMNLGIEGEMLVGACAAAVVGIATGNAWLGVLGALLSGGLMGLLHAFICIRFHANQTVVGTGVNILATGITPLVLQTLYDSGAASPATPTLEAWSVPFLRDIPFLGAVLGTHSPLTYLALLLVPVSSFVLFRTRFG